MKQTMKQIVVLVVAIFSLVACDKVGSLQGTKDRATAEGEANNEVQLKTQAAKAEKMEAELKEKHFFFSESIEIFICDLKKTLGHFLSSSTQFCALRL